MLRYVIVVLSAIAGAALGLFGGIEFFALIDPHPNVSTQDAMGEGLLVMFCIAPACAIAAGVIAVKVTKYHCVTFEVAANAKKMTIVVLGTGLVVTVVFCLLAAILNHRWGLNYRFDVVNKTGHQINELAVYIDGKAVASSDSLADGGSYTQFSPPGAVPEDAEVRWIDGATRDGEAHLNKVRIQAVLPPNFGEGSRADSVYLIVQPSNTVDVKTAPAGDVEAHRAMYR